MKTIGVEIGSCEGRSACFALDALADIKSNAVLHCVDLWEQGQGITPEKHSHWKAHHQFRENIQSLDLENKVMEHQGDSFDISLRWRDSIDYLFIDGSHSYEHVLADYSAWCVYVKTGGVLAFHDANQEGVRLTIETIPHILWEPIPTDQSGRIIAFIKK